MAKRSFLKRLADRLRGGSRGKRDDFDDLLDDIEIDEPRPPAARDEAPKEDADEPVWPKGRLAIAERLWGESHLTPGGEDYALTFTRLLGLSEASSMLNLAAGLGGPARAWAEESGVWVDGLESDEALATLGAERSFMAGLQRKASIKFCDPETIVLKPKKFNAVVGFEPFWTVIGKERLFAEINKSLRTDGHFLFTDFVLAGTNEPPAAVKRWFTTEPVKPHLWTGAQMVNLLRSLDFDLRVAEDISDNYRKRVIRGWAGLVATLTRAQLTPEFAADLLAECEYWLYRVAAIDSRALRVYRYHAIRLPETRK